MSQTSGSSSPSQTWQSQELGKVKASLFQRAFFRKNYLRDGETLEARLLTVAKTAALAELIHHPNAKHWPLYDGVRIKRQDVPKPGFPGQYQRLILTCLPGLTETEREANFFRFISNLNRLIQTDSEAKKIVDHWTSVFYDEMAAFRFLPSSPVLLNAGRAPHQMASCFGATVPDSLEGITKILQTQALIHKTGAGLGLSFDALRPAGHPVSSTGGTASGVLNFIRAFDNLASVVKKGGAKKAASLGALPYWHPEIREFIALKSKPGRAPEFNFAIGLDDAFMKAAMEDGYFHFRNPQDGKKMGRGSARTLLDIIIESVWKTGSPRVLFMDRTYQSLSNPCPDLKNPLVFNAKGEQPLYENEAAHLGSLNVAAFLEGNDRASDPNWSQIEKTAAIALRFLDNLIDVNHYPFPEFEQNAKTYRRVGLGLTGFADFLLKKGVPYESEDAVQWAKKTMGAVQKSAFETSLVLGKEKGAFPKWSESVYAKLSAEGNKEPLLVRNAARTTIAETSHLSRAIGVDGTGIEPFRELYEDPSDSSPRALSHQAFEKTLMEKNYFGFSPPELEALIVKNGGSLKGLSEIPEETRRLFALRHDVSPETHLQIQAAFQNEVDHAVAKTIFLPSDAGPDVVERLLWEAYRLGVKSLLFWRQGLELEPLFSPKGLDGEKRNPVLDWDETPTALKRGEGVIKVGHFAGKAWVLDGLAEDPEENDELASLCLFVTSFLKNGGSLGGLIRDLEPALAFDPGEFGDVPRLTPAQAVLAGLKSFYIRRGLTPGDDGAEKTMADESDPSFELWRLLSRNARGESVH